MNDETNNKIMCNFAINENLRDNVEFTESICVNFPGCCEWDSDDERCVALSEYSYCYINEDSEDSFCSRWEGDLLGGCEDPFGNCCQLEGSEGNERCVYRSSCDFPDS